MHAVGKFTCPPPIRMLVSEDHFGSWPTSITFEYLLEIDFMISITAPVSSL